MTAIPTARQSKTNWMKTHLKYCSRLNNKSFDKTVISDSLIVGLPPYSKSGIKFLNRGNKVQHVLSRAHDSRKNIFL